MPSTSGRAASYPSRQDKLKFFHELKTLRDRLLLQKGRRSTEASQPTATCSDTEISQSTTAHSDTEICQPTSTCSNTEISQPTTTTCT